jgi:hypothetical protein
VRTAAGAVKVVPAAKRERSAELATPYPKRP